MATVSTGQITIVDNNDAKPITLFLSTAGNPVQQTFTKDDTSISYNPDYVTTNLVISPKIYVGAANSALDISTSTTQVLNRWWGKTVGGKEIYNGTSTNQDTSSFVATNGSTAVSSPFTVATDGKTLTISGNLRESITTYPIVFEADYKDLATGLVTHIIATIEIAIVKTGTNAVYVRTRGYNSIEESTTGTKNSIALCADLMRSSGVDRTSLEYKWYSIVNGTATQIDQGFSGYSTKFGFSDTSSTGNPVTVALNTAVPSAGAALSYNSSGTGTGNTITISETAVNDIGLFRVDIRDTVENKTYSGYFTIYDVTDPYQVDLISSTGDKLPNGTGQTTITTKVYQGSTLVNTADWTFTWTFYDREGKRAGFIDTGDTTAAASMYNAGTGRLISANAGSNGTGTYTITFDAVSTALSTTGAVIYDMVKVVKDGIATYYEISAATTTTVTLKTSGQTALTLSDYPLPTASALVGGYIFPCTTPKGQRTGASITVTGYDIDVKGKITCDANRP